MAGSQLPNSVNMTYVKEVPELIDNQVQVKNPTHIEESHNHAYCFWKILGRRALYGEYYLLEKAWHGKSEPQHEVLRMELDGCLSSLTTWFMATLSFARLTRTPDGIEYLYALRKSLNNLSKLILA